jgi:hypothetical protein
MRKSAMPKAAKATQELIERMVKRISKKFHPDKIIIFGSHHHRPGTISKRYPSSDMRFTILREHRLETVL